MVDVYLVNVGKIYNRPMDPMACSGDVSYNQPVRQGNVQFKKKHKHYIVGLALVGLPIPILRFQNPLKYGFMVWVGL